jgi:putative two-component system response regulator
VRARTRNLVALGRAQGQLADRSRQLAGDVRRAVATIEKREKETIIRLARAAEYRDWETGGHILRIAEYARIVARGLDATEEFCEDIALAAPLHDIGKIGIPDYVLCKPDRLDPEEFELMQKHTIIGHEILKGSHSRLLQLGGEIALTHHERFDGTGYPHHLVGHAIPLAGRIVSVADVFDAVTSRRPYKAAFPASEARAVLQRGSGTQFDPSCVEAFLNNWDAVMETYHRFADDSPHTADRLADPLLV